MLAVKNEESLVTVQLRVDEYQFFQKWLSEQMKKEETDSLEGHIRWAHTLKRKAMELYPNKRFKVSVDTRTKAIEFACISEQDTFWNNVVGTQVLLEINKVLHPELEDTIQAKIVIE